jgi:hypothetical protein
VLAQGGEPVVGCERPALIAAESGIWESPCIGDNRPCPPPLSPVASASHLGEQRYGKARLGTTR